MLTWTMAHHWMTLFILALMIFGLVVIVACVCGTIEKLAKIKNRPSALERIFTLGNNAGQNED